MLQVAKKLTKQIYPIYKGRKITAIPAKELRFIDTNWCEGTRKYYTAVNLQTGETKKAVDYAPWANPVEGQIGLIPEGFGVLVHSYSGQYQSVTLYYNTGELLPTLSNSTGL